MPVLDEEAALPALLDHLAALPGRWEVLLADGGSSDATRAIAAAHPLAPRVLAVSGGRARQCNVAAGAARGDPIVFLHADSRLPPGAWAALRGAVEAGAPGGNFRLRFDGDDRFSAVLGAVYALQRRLGVFYGDSTMWLTRERLQRLGGFPELEIMEDYALARSLHRDGAVCLPGPATTSSRRWRRWGIPRTVATWLAIRWLWVAGVPAERLARLYRAVR